MGFINSHDAWVLRSDDPAMFCVGLFSEARLFWLLLVVRRVMQSSFKYWMLNIE